AGYLTVEDRHPGAPRRHQPRGGQADPRGPAGDEGRQPAEFLWVGSGHRACLRSGCGGRLRRTLPGGRIAGEGRRRHAKAGRRPAMSFEGWPAEALDFYEGLEADNSKAYWTAHKAVYDEKVLAPMTELVEELAPEFGVFKIFRPYRDIRFSKDKSPYQTHIG